MNFPSKLWNESLKKSFKMKRKILTCDLNVNRMTEATKICEISVTKHTIRSKSDQVFLFVCVQLPCIYNPIQQTTLAVTDTHIQTHTTTSTRQNLASSTLGTACEWNVLYRCFRNEITQTANQHVFVVDI